MSEKVYIARNYRSKFDAAGKAKMDCEAILQHNGWKNIGFKQTWIANGLLGTLISALGVTWALLRLKRGSQLCLQYPFNKFFRYCLWGAKLKQCDVVCIIHDIRSLKGKYGYEDSEMSLLRRLDKCIVHNDIMKQWLSENGVRAPMVSLGIFDYLHTITVDPKRTPMDIQALRVVFAGKMGNFVYRLDELKAACFKFNLYGVGFKPEKVRDPAKSVLDYKGFFPADKVIDMIDGDFGLVWYGESLDSCDGSEGHYLKFNNPHKLSLYLLCDMPVIIWDKAAMAPFVSREGIGITVDSLHELEDRLSSLTPEDIKKMKENVAQIKAKLQRGEYLSQALDAIEQLSH